MSIDMGKRLNAARMQSKISLVELGRRLGVGDTTVMRWEKGSPIPA